MRTHLHIHMYIMSHVLDTLCFLFQIHSFVRFVNVTERRVNVVWLNYEGERVHYKTLQPQHFVDVNTFVGHPWIFQDADTGDKLVVQLKEEYQPIGFSMKADGWPPQRKIVKISVPGNGYHAEPNTLEPLTAVPIAVRIFLLLINCKISQELMP